MKDISERADSYNFDVNMKALLLFKNINDDAINKIK